ncbi:alpha/beta hydrolase [Kordia sp.]|uniref:alpha/beta hydrolase n=1 Tax=Kordia sp. TaxID=1965332 RepID=UPI003B5B6364
MKLKNSIFFITLTGVLMLSCQSNRIQPLEESKFYTDSIFSESLDEYRKHNVYLPKGFDRQKKYPIMYATDGSKSIKESPFKSVMDSLIEHKIVKPYIYIASHSNSKVADSSGTLGNGDTMYLAYRYFEYVDQYAEGHNSPELADRFKNHMHYFNNELITSVEHTFNQKITKEDRYFYGFSNGAGFGLHLLNRHPETIGTYLCFSTFGGNVQSNTWKENVEYPKLYLEYGSEEPFFLKEDADFLKEKFENLHLFAEINEFQGGHDYKIWNEKFIEITTQLLQYKSTKH